MNTIFIRPYRVRRPNCTDPNNGHVCCKCKQIKCSQKLLTVITVLYTSLQVLLFQFLSGNVSLITVGDVIADNSYYYSTNFVPTSICILTICTVNIKLKAYTFLMLFRIILDRIFRVTLRRVVLCPLWNVFYIRQVHFAICI